LSALRGLHALLGRPVPQSPLALFGTDRLVVRGIDRWIRHPMCVGGFVFLVTSGPSQNNVVFTGMYAAYMRLGAFVERRPLLRLFGDPYRGTAGR
jgi:methanethiol S-methyltransferase